MSTKHTPGPWVAIFPDSRIHYGGSDITSFEVMTEKTRGEFRAEGRDHYHRRHEDVSNVEIVSMQFWRDMTDEEAKANARLIAAAPELLEALQDMLAGWKYIRDSHGDLYGVGWDRAQNKAEAAILKATGEQA